MSVEDVVGFEESFIQCNTLQCKFAMILQRLHEESNIETFSAN